ncbi:MAG: hypothetical protein ACXWFS_08410, partial [Thermoanaerobaculia bacterium]
LRHAAVAVEAQARRVAAAGVGMQAPHVAAEAEARALRVAAAGGGVQAPRVAEVEVAVRAPHVAAAEVETRDVPRTARARYVPRLGGVRTPRQGFAFLPLRMERVPAPRRELEAPRAALLRGAAQAPRRD